MEKIKNNARALLTEFKGDDFIYGLDCLDRIGETAASVGRRIFLISSLDRRDVSAFTAIKRSLREAGVDVCGMTSSSRPNSPREDILRMKTAIESVEPDCILAASGGSGIDAAKAALVLADLGGDFDDYFGVDRVTDRLARKGGSLRPCLALQTASGSAAHLTKYSNITDLNTHQKKLIVDDAVVPPKSLFDYSLTRSMSADFTCDGAFDGLAHCLEVYYGARPEVLDKIEGIALTGIELILASLETAVRTPSNLQAREALGLATDLGGYAIMVGGTNGAHLTSFSLVDILSHGRACALLNPYYTVFFAPAIPRQLTQMAHLMERYGLVDRSAASLKGRELGIAVAQGLIRFGQRVGFPTTLQEIPGMTENHIRKALDAAKNPQLEMKLKNMPIPLTADQIETHMAPVLRSAYHGDFSVIKNLES